MQKVCLPSKAMRIKVCGANFSLAKKEKESQLRLISDGNFLYSKTDWLFVGIFLLNFIRGDSYKNRHKRQGKLCLKSVSKVAKCFKLINIYFDYPIIVLAIFALAPLLCFKLNLNYIHKYIFKQGFYCIFTFPRFANHTYNAENAARSNFFIHIGLK
jgi:hypothetical protein